MKNLEQAKKGNLKYKKWRITKIANSAIKNIETLNFKSQKEVIKQFETLQDNPFNKNIKKVVYITYIC